MLGTRPFIAGLILLCAGGALAQVPPPSATTEPPAIAAPVQPAPAVQPAPVAAPPPVVQPALPVAAPIVAPVPSASVGQPESEAVREIYEHPNKGHEAFRLDWDNHTSLSVNLLGQAQVATYVQKDALVDNGDPASAEGFRLRRARVGFFGSYKDVLGISLVIDVKDQDSGGTTLSTATLLYKPYSFLNLALGTATLPFSRGAFASSSRLQMIERPMSIQRIVPGAQLGFAALGVLAGGIVEYATGIYNGQPGRYGLGPLDRGFLYAARLQVAPLGRMAPGESDYDQSPLRFAVGGDTYYSEDASIKTHAASADVALKWRGFSLLGEVIWDRREPMKAPVAPTSLPSTTDRLAFYAQAGYFVVPRLLELAARYEWYDDHRHVSDAGDIWLATGGVNLFLLEGYLKVQLNYQHRGERKVPELKNDVMFLQFQVNL